MEKHPKTKIRKIGKQSFREVDEFAFKREAIKLAKEIRKHGNNARVLPYKWQGDTYYKVFIGKKRK